jgi:hypothetical protein
VSDRLRTWLGLEIGFIDHLTLDSGLLLIMAPSLISTLYKSLQHTLSLSSLLCLLGITSNIGVSSLSEELGLSFDPEGGQCTCLPKVIQFL